MILTSLDLELNQPSNKIISVGYCQGNLETGEILSQRDVFVKIDEPLNPYITGLTGITEETLATKGVSLLKAYQILKEDHIKAKAFVNPLTWGGGDTDFLRQQLGKNQEKWLFGRRWIDCKTVYISYRMSQGQPFKSGLAKSMKAMGLEFEGTNHASVDDAINTFNFYRFLLDKFNDK